MLSDFKSLTSWEIEAYFIFRVPGIKEKLASPYIPESLMMVQPKFTKERLYLNGIRNISTAFPARID